MELSEVKKSLDIVYQPHPITPALGRQGMVAVATEGTTVREILLASGVDPHQPIIVSLDGELLKVEQWDIVCPTEGQLLNVQATVAGGEGGSNVMQVVLMIAVVVAASVISGGALAPAGAAGVGSIFAAGGVGAIIAATVVSVAGSLIIGALFAPQAAKTQQAPQVSPTYSLSGGSNRSRPYESMPVVMGEHRLFADYAARPYAEYRGNDQYLYQIFHLGLGSITAVDFNIGTTPLGNYSDFEIIAPNASGQLNGFPGNVDTAAGASLTFAASWIQRTTSVNTTKIGLDLESVIFFTNDKGQFQARTVTIEVQYKVTGTNDWVSPTTLDIYGDNYTYSAGVITVTGATQKPSRASLEIAGLSAGQYDVRLRRTTEDSENARDVRNTNWSAIKSYQTDTATYVGQNRIGLIIKATEQLNGVVQQLSAQVSADATYWNGSAWVSGKTSNPAHWFMQFAKGFYNGDGKLMYGIGLSDSQIDLAALHAWAGFCATEGLTFNAVIDGSQTAADIINLIATNGFGSATWASGKLGVVYDVKNASPVAAFGMSNIIKDSFEVAYISENLADEIVVRFRNPLKDWEQDEVRVLAPNVVTPVRTSSIELFGCTNAAMAGKFANYIAAQQFYRRRRITWQSDFEGFVCQRGDVVLLSHDLTQWGYSGRFVNVNGLTITLDRAVPRNGEVEYLMLIRPNGTTSVYNVAAASGESDTITLTNFMALQSGADLIDHRWCFSPLATPGKKVKILSVQPASDSRLQITATDEYPEFYTAWGGAFVNPPPSTVLPGQSTGTQGLTATVRQVVVNGYLVNRVSLSWRMTGNSTYSLVRMYLDGNLIREIAETFVPYAEIDLNSGGQFYAEVTPFSSSGAGTTETVSLLLGGLNLPSPPTSVTVEAGEDGKAATFTWDEVAGVQSYVIEIFNAGIVRRAVNIGNSLTYTYTVDDSLADGGPFRSYEFRVYSVNQEGQSQTFAAANFGNPQIGALQNIRVDPMPTSIVFRCDLPTDPDFAAIRIWLSRDSGFAVSNNLIVYDGSDNWVTISSDALGDALEPGVTYYLRAAGYDTFGDDNLVVSGQFAIVTLGVAWGLMDGDIEETVLSLGLRERIDLIDTIGPSDLPNGIIDRVRQQATELNILDGDVNVIGERLLESALKIQENTELLYDAGVTVDSTTGEVYIFAVREAQNQINEVDIRLNAAESNITLKASFAYVDEAIATAVIDPSQIIELEDVYARLTSAEIDIDGLDASITLKADLLLVENQAVRLSTAEIDIDALEGAITLKADNTELTAIDARVTTTEITLNTLDIPGITQSVTDVRLLNRAQDKIAETQLRDILTGQANYEDLDVAVARAENNLTAYVNEELEAEAAQRLLLQAVVENTAAAVEQETIARVAADEAEASQRLLLEAQVNDNNALIVSEQIARATADDALSSQFTSLSAVVGENTAAIQSESSARATADEAIATDIQTLSAVVDGNIAAIQTETTARVNGDSALASQITTVQSTVNGNTTSIQTNTSSINGIEGKYSVKIDNNGYITGFGLISTANNATPFSEFTIVADRFSFAPVATNPLAADGSPFFSLTAPQTIDGKTFQPGTYLKKAFVGTLDATSITTGTLDTNTLVANESITAAKIDTRNLTIKDGAGNVIFSSGTNLDLARVAGAGQFASLNQINSGNISTYIAGAAIQTLQVNNAAITTLKVDGNAITQQFSTGRFNAGQSDVTFTTSTGGAFLAFLYIREGLGNASNPTKLFIRNVLTPTPTEMLSLQGIPVLDPNNNPVYSPITAMALIGIGPGTYLFSGQSQSASSNGFVISGLLTQR